MSTHWYKKSKLNPLWQSRSKQLLGEKEESLEVKVDEIEMEIPYPLEMFQDTDKKDIPVDENNVHSYPYMQIVASFNDVTTLFQNEAAIVPDKVLAVLQTIERVYPRLETEREQEAIEEALEYIEVVYEGATEGYPFKDLYPDWFAAIQKLRGANPDYVRYIVAMDSPESFLNSDGQFDNDFDEFYETFPHGDYDAVLTGDFESPYFEEEYMDDDDYPAQVDVLAYTAEKREKGIATKHNLSIRQLSKAYNRAYNKIMGANGNWVLASTMFSGLSKWELDALQEEGLIKVQGGKMTLTRLGYERPQWFRY